MIEELCETVPLLGLERVRGTAFDSRNCVTVMIFGGARAGANQ